MSSAAETSSTATDALEAPIVMPPVPTGWKIRLDDPFNRYYRYPIARFLVRTVFVKTPITPNQISLLTVVFAAAAGWLLTYNDSRALLLAAALFEIRSILDCADGTLARAKNLMSPWGHAIDAMADWLGVVFLYGGIFWHFRLYPPAPGPWNAYISNNGILLLALFQAATRSFAADYYKTKYVSVFERGNDETVDALRRKLEALERGRPSIFAHIDVFIGRMGHLCFGHEWFDPQRSTSSTTEEHVKQLKREEGSGMSRFLGFIWAVSNGDFFLSLVVLTILADCMWLGQVFFATAGVVSIFGVIFLNGAFVRGVARRAERGAAEVTS